MARWTKGTAPKYHPHSTTPKAGFKTIMPHSQEGWQKLIDKTLLELIKTGPPQVRLRAVLEAERRHSAPQDESQEANTEALQAIADSAAATDGYVEAEVPTRPVFPPQGSPGIHQVDGDLAPPDLPVCYKLEGKKHVVDTSEVVQDNDSDDRGFGATITPMPASGQTDDKAELPDFDPLSHEYL